MAAAVPTLADTRCPLCGAPILTVGFGGRVTWAEARVVPVGASRAGGTGYLVCEDCGRLAELPVPARLN